MTVLASAADRPVSLGSKPLRESPTPESAIATSIFTAFFALYMLGMVDHMLHEFTDGADMLRAAERMLDHGIGSTGEAMHEKWCLGQLLLDLVVVWLRRLTESTSPIQQLISERLQNVVPASLGASIPTLVYLSGRRLDFRRSTSAFVAVGVGIGSITWVYTQILFSESTLAVAWLIVFYAMLRFRDTRQLRWLVIASTAGGYALITKAVTAAALPVLPLWAALVMRDHARSAKLTRGAVITRACAIVMPLAAFAALNLWYNHARFGSILDSGYGGGRDGAGGGFTTPVLVGLFGLVLSPGKGFFFYNPIAILGVLGMRAFVRRHRLPGLAILAIIAVLVLVHARWWAWHGDFAWGPRFMVPLAPMFGLLSLSTVERTFNLIGGPRALRLLLMAALLQLSIAVQLLGLAFDPGRFIDIVSDKCKILRGGSYYTGERFPLLDDGLIVHFVPHFSPIAGHLWMLRAALARDESRRLTILDNPPWRSLNPHWVPKHSERTDTSLGMWWIHPDNQTAERRATSRTLAASLCLLLLGASWTMIRQLRARPGPRARRARRPA